MVLGDAAARKLMEQWGDHATATSVSYLLLCIFLVCFAGCMSGLTLGLMSMDIVELEVLRRSGSELEAKQAARIIPVVKDAHFLLVTLLLCNAVAMEALPIFLNKIMDEFVAILVSVTAVLFMGEILPQAACSKHGLVIGSAMAVPVRVLMLLTSPLSFPIAKLLDFVLGGEHASLFRRKQLKALVTLHAKDEGFGGRLTSDEIQIITGALDLTRKTAFHAMTPLDKVFMLSSEQKLDDATVSAVMASKPFSRLPVYRGSNKQDIIGVILVKELLEYVKNFPDSPVSSMMIRQLPRLPADVPMYDLLKLFRVGRSHMALLTQPHPEPSETSTTQQGDGAAHAGGVFGPAHHRYERGGPLHYHHAGVHTRVSLATVHEGPVGLEAEPSGLSPLHTKGNPTAEHSHGFPHKQQVPLPGLGESSVVSTSTQITAGREGSVASATPPKKGLLTSLMSNMGLGAGGSRMGDPEESQPMLRGAAGSSMQVYGGGMQMSAFQVYANEGFEVNGGSPHAASESSRRGSTPVVKDSRHSGNGETLTLRHSNNNSAAQPDVEGTSLHAAPSSTGRSLSNLRNLFGGQMDGDTDKGAKSRRKKRSKRRRRASLTLDGGNPADTMEQGQQGRPDDSTSSSTDSTCSTGSSRDDLEDMLPVPLIATPGEAIGIITIEDVIEELMGIEILDETDRFIDNEQSIPVNTKGLEADLPDHLRAVLTVAERAKHQVLTPGLNREAWLLQAAAAASGGVSSAQGPSAHQQGPATSVLAGLAGSMFRHAFGADPLAHAMAHARQNMRAPSPPKRGPELGRGSAPLVPAISSGVGSGGMSAAGSLAPSVQRSDIRAAAVMAAGLGSAGQGTRKTFANWKLLENSSAPPVRVPLTRAVREGTANGSVPLDATRSGTNSGPPPRTSTPGF